MAISNEEAKQLLYDETPVYLKNIKYKKINGLIYRKSEGRFKASAELLDMNHNCVVICPLEWIDASEEERIEIFGQEEAEVLLTKCKEEMATLINLVDQNKPDESQDSLHRLLSKLMKLDNELIKQVHAREKYGDDPKEGMEKITNELAESFSLGGLNDKEGKERIPQRKEEEEWIAN
ncbi:hypothetical protein [Anaerococcus vaginalis]|uniref:hypothetical protein n=1 Tax=Anaerococcus vaginalis TaxID=33037 RepID=UPI001896E570|nr:hypothetical protein [Anaerococcus vaginalis]